MNKNSPEYVLRMALKRAKVDAHNPAYRIARYVRVLGFPSPSALRFHFCDTAWRAFDSDWVLLSIDLRAYTSAQEEGKEKEIAMLLNLTFRRVGLQDI